jgi:hypothetical protein
VGARPPLVVDRSPLHTLAGPRDHGMFGYAETREAAMTAFAKSWRRAVLEQS